MGTVAGRWRKRDQPTDQKGFGTTRLHARREVAWQARIDVAQALKRVDRLDKRVDRLDKRVDRLDKQVDVQICGLAGVGTVEIGLWHSARDSGLLTGVNFSDTKHEAVH